MATGNPRCLFMVVRQAWRDRAVARGSYLWWVAEHLGVEVPYGP